MEGRDPRRLTNSLQLMAAFVDVPMGGDSSHRVRLVNETTTIGRDISNEIALRLDEQVSRFHAVLVRYPAGHCVRDVGSSNGTFVNGKRIAGDHHLHNGDMIRLGTTTLAFYDDSGEDLSKTVVTERGHAR